MLSTIFNKLIVTESNIESTFVTKMANSESNIKAETSKIIDSMAESKKSIAQVKIVAIISVVIGVAGIIVGVFV